MCVSEERGMGGVGGVGVRTEVKTGSGRILSRTFQQEGRNSYTLSLTGTQSLSLNRNSPVCRLWVSTKPRYTSGDFLRVPDERADEKKKPKG